VQLTRDLFAIAKFLFTLIYLQFYYIAVAVTWYRVRFSKSTGRPNFIHIGPSAAKIRRLISFHNGSRGSLVLLPVSFVSSDVTHFQKPKSICKPNFVDVSQLTAEI